MSTRVVNAEMRNWIFVKVETNVPGLYGWGEATLEWKTRAVVGAIEDLTELIIGRDPRDIEQLVEIMKKHSFWPLGAIGSSALSGIEIALWDILGKELSQPVWRLLGGQVRDRVKVYTHLGLGDMRAVYETQATSALVENALKVVEAGYNAFKVVIIPYTHYFAELSAIKRVESMADALRNAVGTGVEIMIDFHGRPASAGAALSFIEAVAPAKPLFVEEVVPPGDLSALAQVLARAKVPIATGERLFDRREFDALLRAAPIDIVQPDICHCGGLLEAKKIASLAEGRAAGVAPHNPLGPIAGVAALHFAVSTPNHLIQEEMVGAVPWFGEVVKGPIKMIGGAWQVPTGVGLGLEVDEHACDRYPFKAEVQHATNAVLSDGTIANW